MLRNTAAVRALQDGCRRLSIPTNTAIELLQFLSTKRLHDHVDSSNRQLNMSPGATVDKLWHFMLVNTTVSSQVHDLLGGVVEHRHIDHTDLPDDTKLLQRLYSMNVMRMEGHEPDLELWTEPGTVMHSVLLRTTPVPALQHLRGGGSLYVTPTLNRQLQEQLVQALQLLYADDEVYNTVGDGVQAASPQHSTVGRRRTRQQAANAGETAAAAAPRRTRQARGTCVNQQQPSQVSVTPQQLLQQQQQQGQQGPMPIIMMDQLGAEVHFKVWPSTRFQKVQDAYCKLKNLDPALFVFLFDGQRCLRDQTIAWHEMEDGDVVDVRMLQTGC